MKASVALAAVVGLLCAASLATAFDDCVVKPAPAIVSVDNAWTPNLFGSKVKPLLVDDLHGSAKSNAAWLAIPPGRGFPPHRHPGAEEYIYYLSGTGEQTTWLPGTPAKTTASVKAGDWHFLPDGGIHSMVNTGDDDLVMLVMGTPPPLQIETFQQWPDSLDVPQGDVVSIMALIPGCPPGQESKQDEL